MLIVCMFRLVCNPMLRRVEEPTPRQPAIPSSAVQLTLQSSSQCSTDASVSRSSAPYRATYLLAPPPSTALAEGAKGLKASPRPLSARFTALHLSLQLPAESADAGTVEKAQWQRRRDEAFVSGTGRSRPATARSAAARCPAGWNGCRSARAAFERSPLSVALSGHRRHSVEGSPQRMTLLEWQPLTTRALEGAGLLGKAHLGTNHRHISALPTAQRMHHSKSRSKSPTAVAPLPGTIAPSNSPPQTPLHTPLRTPTPTPPQTPLQSPPQSPPPELADAPETALPYRQAVRETALKEEHQSRQEVLDTAFDTAFDTALATALEVALATALPPPQAVTTPSALTSPAASAASSALRPRSGAVPVPKCTARLLEMSSATLDIPPAIAHSARGGVYSPRQLRLIGGLRT